MPDLDGQEREALEHAFQELWDGSLFGDQEQPARGMAEVVFRRGYQAALNEKPKATSSSGTVRERADVPVELQRRFLNDAEFHAEVELARGRLLADGSAVTTEAVILVVNALHAAREEPREKILDLGGERHVWRVVSDHAVDDPDVRSAAVHAAVTGSVGWTYNDATVERCAREANEPSDSASLNREVDTDSCQHCGKLILIPGRVYGIHPAAVCRCGDREANE